MIEIGTDSCGTESVNGFYLQEYMQPDPEMMKTYCKCFSLGFRKEFGSVFHVERVNGVALLRLCIQYKCIIEV